MRFSIIFILLSILATLVGCTPSYRDSCQGPYGDYYRVVVLVPANKQKIESSGDMATTGFTKGRIFLTNNSPVIIPVGGLQLGSGTSVDLTYDPKRIEAVKNKSFNEFLINNRLFMRQIEDTNIWVIEKK